MLHQGACTIKGKINVIPHQARERWRSSYRHHLGHSRPVEVHTQFNVDSRLEVYLL